MRRICFIGLVFYLLCLGAVTLAPFDFQQIPQPYRWEKSLGFSFFDIVLNLLLFLPLGGLLCGLSSRRPRLPLILFISAAVSSVIEVSQLFLPVRFPSYSDLIANTLGGGAGFLLFKASADRGWLRRRGPHRRRLAQLGFLLYAGFLLFLAGFSWEKLDRWDPDAFLWVGIDPEMEDGWKGKLYRLAVYDRSLDPDTIRRHYQAGISAPPEIYLQQNPIVLYLFDEREGETLHDRSEMLPPLDLRLLNPDGGRWLSPFGYDFNRSASFISREPAEKVRRRISSGHQFAIEAWVEIGPLPYEDRGRLVSLAKGPEIEYFLLQQGGADLGFEVRNGVRIGFPNLGNIETIQLPLPQGVSHLVSVYHRGRTGLYVNGTPVAEAILTDGLFLLTDSLALRTTIERDRGLLGLLLFLPAGFLAVLSGRSCSARGFCGTLLFALFVALVFHLLQSRHDPVFLAGGYIFVPSFAIFLGALTGQFVRKALEEPL